MLQVVEGYGQTENAAAATFTCVNDTSTGNPKDNTILNPPLSKLQSSAETGYYSIRNTLGIAMALRLDSSEHLGVIICCCQTK